MLDYFGWLACGVSLFGTSLATSYTRKYVFWGWCCLFTGNMCWIVYGASTATLPLIVYNSIRALFSLRGAHNNTWRRKQAIRAKRKQQCGNHP